MLDLQTLNETLEINDTNHINDTVKLNETSLESEINATAQELNTAGDVSDNFKVHWSDMGLKTLCPTSEWQSQFKTVRVPFTRCLGFSEIIIDEKNEQKEEEAKSFNDFDYEETYFLEPMGHPHCKLAEKWDACGHYLEGLNCIEADYRSLVESIKERDYYRRMRLSDHFDDDEPHEDSSDDDKHENENENENETSMSAAYKQSCELHHNAYPGYEFGGNQGSFGF